MMKNPLFKAGLIVFSLFLLGIFTGIFTSSYYSQPKSSPQIQGLLWPNPKQLGPFTTIDHNGEAFGLEQLRGKWSFLFFGYTHCPDVCPITLTVMNEVKSSLSGQGQDKNMQVVFVTVDPERDTQQKLADYVAYFNSDFIGLGGNQEQVESLTKQIGVAYMHGEKDDHQNYLVDHSASLFLVDPFGRLLAVLSAPHNTNTISERFLEIKKFLDTQQND